MAIQVGGTTVIDNSRNLQNVQGIKTVGGNSILGSGDIAISASTYSSSAPSSPSNGDLWVDTASGFLKVRFNGTWQEVEYVGDGNSHSGAHLYVRTQTNSSDTFTFTVPNGVKNMSVVCIGSGGTSGSTEYGNGGGGLAYKNNISVQPGDTFTVELNATHSRIVTDSSSSSIDVKGLSASTNSRTAGGYSGGDGGGSGGNGGQTTYSNGPYYSGSGSGGAGGYSGSGGAGASGTSLSGFAGSAGASNSGAGGGGGSNYDTGYNVGYAGGAAGGGTGIYGKGSTGAGGSGDTNPGSTGTATPGGNGSADATDIKSTGTNFFGCGGNAGYSGTSNSNSTPKGAVRIVWGIGNNQSFPSTNVGYRDGVGNTVQEYDNRDG